MHKLIKVTTHLFFVLSLFSCGGGEDNSEPPAELEKFEATAKLDLLWTSSLSSGVDNQYLFIEPLLLDEKIIMAGRDGFITIINPSSGDVIKEFDIGAVISGGVGGNESMWLVSSRSGNLIAIDAKKLKVAWTSKMPSEVLAHPQVFDGAAYVRTVDGQIVSVELSTGKIKWTYTHVIPDLTLRGSSPPVITKDRVYVGLENGRIVALSTEKGEVIWNISLSIPEGRSEIQRLVDIDGKAGLYGNLLYMSSFQGRIAAIDTDRGQLNWSRPFSTYSGLSLDKEVLYSSDERSHLWALDRFNGATLWKQEKLQARHITRPVKSDEYLIVGDYAGYVHVLSKFDGQFVARHQVETDVDEVPSETGYGIIAPPIVYKNTVIVTSRNGSVYAYAINKI